jgi:hypothetical protein
MSNAGSGVAPHRAPLERPFDTSFDTLLCSYSGLLRVRPAAQPAVATVCVGAGLRPALSHRLERVRPANGRTSVP